MSNTAFNIDNPNTGNAAPSPSARPFYLSLLERAKEILFSPETTWEKIKNDSTSITDIYKNYAAFLLGVTPLFMWIQQSIIGYGGYGIRVRLPFFSGLVAAVLLYAASLATLYVAALVLEKISPKLESKITLTNSFKLIAYSMTPVALVGVLAIFPSLYFIAMLGAMAYATYLIYVGIPKLAVVSETKRMPYLGATVGITLIVGALLSWIAMSVSPIGGPSITIGTGSETIDLNKLEEQMKELQKNFPKP